MIARRDSRGTWPWLMVVLAGVVPFGSDMSRNFQLFTPAQIAWSLAVVVAGTSAVAGVTWLLARIARGALRRAGGKGLERIEPLAFALAAGFVLALFLFDSNMTELRTGFGLSRWAAAAVVVALFGVYSAVAAGLGPRLLCILLLGLLGVRFVQTGLAVSKTTARGDQLVSSEEVAVYQDVVLERKPNIYFICLESYHGRNAMRELYGIDNSATLGFLERSGFVIADDTLANYWYTMASTQSFLQMGHHYAAGAFGNHDSLYARGFVSGSGTFYNPVLNILKRNGYSVVYLLPSDYYYRPGAGLVDVSLLERSWPFAPLKASLPRFLGREPDTYVENYERKVYEAVASWPAGKPAFFYAKFGAEHTAHRYDYRTDREGFVKQYGEALARANRQIEKLCTKIIARDPGGIVILAGDHGAQSYRAPGGFRVPLNEGVPAERLVRDFHDVFLAIRWGDGIEPAPYPFRSLVNVMRYVFQRLGGGEALLATVARDDCYVSGADGVLYKTVEDGRPLAKWEPAPRSRP